MKKICFSLLLVTNVMFVSCAEIEKRNTYDYNKIVPVYTNNFHIFTNSSLETTYNQQNTQPHQYCTANQPGWQQLNAIMNMPYNSCHAVTNEVELKPIYKRATTTITQQEKPNTHLMQTLYKNAYQYADYERTTQQPDWLTSHNNLTLLIHNMNVAKKNNITEDDMGKFAFPSYNRNNISKYIPLIFALLKRYNLTVNDTNEPLPFEIVDARDENLSRIFGIESQKNSQKKQPKSNKGLKQYPAYVDLVDKLKQLKNGEVTDHINTCLYADDTILFSGYSDGSYTNLLSDFYINTYDMLLREKISYWNIYETLLIINKAKQLGAIKKETDLGHSILNFDSNQCSILEQAKHWYKKIDFEIDSKNRIALFCELIERYNNTDTDKQRPTPRQYLCYRYQKTLNLILPDSMTSLNENRYAFTAFEKFVQDCMCLTGSKDNQGIQLSVNKVYYNKGAGQS